MSTVKLPATGRTMPDAPITFGALRQMQTSDGVAYVLPLKYRGERFGEIENQGTGGGTWFRPSAPGAQQIWDEYVARCKELDPARYGPMQTPTGPYEWAHERVADDLVDEVDLHKRLKRTAKSALIVHKAEEWGVEDDLDTWPRRDPYGYASAKGATIDALDTLRPRLLADGFTHYWTGSEWAPISPTPEENSMTVTAPPEDKLAKKAEAERQRQERIKAASKRLAALPKDAQTRVQGNAARAEKAGKEAGKRQASVAYLEEALAAEESKQGTTATSPLTPPRPRGPRETVTPKETPEQLAPEKKKAAPKKAQKRSGATAVEAKVTVTVPATHKTCTRCHESKPVADFLPKSGAGKPRAKCRPCYNADWVEYDRARKAKKAAEAAQAKAS